MHIAIRPTAHENWHCGVIVDAVHAEVGSASSEDSECRTGNEVMRRTHPHVAEKLDDAGVN